jgi:ankyrin repeat protein
MRIRKLTLVVLASCAIHWEIGHARALSLAQTATLTEAGRDSLTPQWRAGAALAGELGKEQNLDALPLLLELRNPEFMSNFVSGYWHVAGARAPTSELEALALKAARDPSFARDDGSWDTRAIFFHLLFREYRSRELFELFYASVRRELTARREGYSGTLPPAQRSLGGSVITSGVAGIEEPIAALLPLLPDACQGLDFVAFLGERQYLPATDRLIELYRRTGVTPRQCAERVAWTLASFHTRPAIQAVVARIRWLLEQPESGPRDGELVSAISTLGHQPVEAQADLGALEADVLARAGTPSLRPELQALFRQQTYFARMARTFDVESLTFFISQDGGSAVVRSLLDHHVDPNGFDRRGESPLVLAACEGNLEIVRMLVEAGADVNRADGRGTLPLEMRCDASWYPGPGVNDERGAEIAQYLLEHGAHVDAIDRMGLTALHAAAAAGNIKVIDVLLDGGARINERKRRAVRHDGTADPRDPIAGWAAIHFAANTANLATVTHLVDRGANINARAADGTTALLIAVLARNEALTRTLVERGADVSQPGRFAITPIIAAHENGDRQTEALLRSKGAVLNPFALARLAIIRAYGHLIAHLYAGD